MSIAAAAGAGAALGVRHALETDHLAAVTTLVEGDRNRSPATVGASWGVGHAVPIVLLGLAFLALGLRLPAGLALAVEGVVALALVAFGLRMVLVVTGHWSVRRHGHPPGGLHRHLRLGPVSLGTGHGHLHRESALVGVLHGLAGSGALVVAMVAASPTAGGALAFLAGFTTLTVGTMTLVSLGWGRAIRAGIGDPLRAVGGLLGIAVGLVLLSHVLGAPIAPVPQLPLH